MKKSVPILTGFLLTALMVAPASAMDYEIQGVAQTEFYRDTAYEDTYGTAYQYGGINAIDFQSTEPIYGLMNTTSIGVLEKPSYNQGLPSSGIAPTIPTVPNIPIPPTVIPPVLETKFTDSEDVVRKNGTLGTLRIPSLDIYAKVYDDETPSSLSKGVGHFTSTSAWDGNVGIAGHNRGSSVVIGDIKDLSLGDRITYTTDLGTRNYAVTMVTQISETDWSYLTATTDNRITLITCVEDEPDLRWCVQAVVQ